MGVGTALRRIAGLEAKGTPLTASDEKQARLWGRLFGYGDVAAGRSVTFDGAMQLAAFWACVKLIAETIATLPLVVYERQGDGGRRVALDHPLSGLLRVSPDGEHTAVEFWEGAALAMCLGGNAYAEKVRLGGRLVALHPLPTNIVSLRRTSDGALEYAIADPGGRRVLGEDDVLHLRAFGNCGDLGFAPLMFARQSIGSAMAADETAGKLFANGARPSGVLEVASVLRKEQREDLRDNIVAPLAGSRNAGGVFVLEGGMKFSPISLSPEDSQLLETRRWHVEEICRWFGVPPVLIGHAAQGQTMWGSGVEQIVLSWLALGLRAQLKRIEAAILLRLFEPVERARYYAEFSVEGLLRADSAGRVEYLSKMVQNGLMSRNEGRAYDNRSPVEGGDDLTVQSNLLPINKLGIVASLPREKPVEPGAVDGATQN